MRRCAACEGDVEYLVPLSGGRCHDCCGKAQREAEARAPMVAVLAKALVKERREHYLLRERVAGRLVGFGLERADVNWSERMMCRVALPVPVREVAEILRVMSKLAQEDGMEARCEQRGQFLEIFKIGPMKGGE
jgi:hypothetical protein